MRKTDDDSRVPEYDFSGGVRGKYAERFKEGVTVREVGSHQDLTRAALERRIAASLIRAQQAEFSLFLLATTVAGEPTEASVRHWNAQLEH